MGAKPFFTRLSTQGQGIFKAPLDHSLFSPPKAAVCPCLFPALLPGSPSVNGRTAGQSGASRPGGLLLPLL